MTDEILEFLQVMRDSGATRRAFDVQGDDDPNALFTTGLLRSAPPPRVECPVKVETLPATLELHVPFALKLDSEVGVGLLHRLMASGPYPLDGVRDSKFEGSGVYALYYCGDRSEYEAIRSVGALLPIYVGKAGRESSQRGYATDDSLWSRLVEHCNGLRSTDLGLQNFVIRLVRLDQSIVEWGENILKEAYRPVWNYALPGFGRGRRIGYGESQKVSKFDTKHPRKFAGREEPIPQVRREVEQVDREIEEGVMASLRAFHRTQQLLEGSKVVERLHP